MEDKGVSLKKKKKKKANKFKKVSKIKVKCNSENKFDLAEG